MDKENILKGITQDDLQRMLKFGKPSNQIGKFISEDFISLPYGIVRKDVPNLLNNDQIKETVESVVKCQDKDFDIEKQSGNEIIAFLLWILKQLEFIGNIEKSNLHTEPKMEMRAAGIDRLNEFGVLGTIHELSGKNILKHKEIEALPYFEIYQILKMQKISGEIEENYNKAMQNK